MVQSHLSTSTSQLFGVEFEIPTLDADELYASKIVAALDRQHPRDLFDIWQLYESGGLSDRMLECFVVYLAGHNRPIHEVLFANDKNIAPEYGRSFVGMTQIHCPLDNLLATRHQLRHELPERLTEKQREFLSGLAWARPDWSLLTFVHAEHLPALRWKLTNLQTFKKRRPAAFEAHAKALDEGLATSTWI